MADKKKKTKRNYTDEAMQEALTQIRNGTPLRLVSRTYNIPRGTLQDRIHGRVMEDICKMGPNTILSEEEEQKIVDWLISLAKCGFPRNREELLSVVQKIVVEDGRPTPFKEGRPGKKWYHRFLKRHPELALRAPEHVSKGRAIITENAIRKWFNDLKAYLTSIGAEEVLEDPSRILNGDETSFAMVPKSGAIIAPKNSRNIYQVNLGKDKETLTVLLVFTASGETLPPMVVFPYVRPPASIVNSMPGNWILGRSESGWMRGDTFYEYVANGLHVWLNENQTKRPVIFFVDGHKSHLTMALSDFCSNNAIILYSLPPNTTHIMQPADVGAFKGLKSDYKQTVRSWQSLPENFGKSVTKTNFCKLLETVLNKKNRTSIVQNAFKKCGLFPFDPNAIDYSKCIQDTLEAIGSTVCDSDNAPSFSKAQYESAIRVITSIREELETLNIDHQIIIDVISSKSEGPIVGNEESNTCLNIEGTYVLGNEGELVKISSDLSDTISLVSDEFSPAVNLVSDTLSVTSEDVDKTLVPDAENDQTALRDITNSSISKPMIEPPASSSVIITAKARRQLSAEFDKHLSYPQPIATSTKREAKQKPPMSVSSEAWKRFYKEKERLQQEKEAKIAINKEQRLEKKLQRDADKLKRQTQKTSKAKRKGTIKCPECEDEVLTDVEEDGLKNIGCDECERWFHLQCTKLSSLAFEEAEKLDFVCSLCDNN